MTRARQRLQLAAVAILPTVLLLVAAELGVRALGLARPRFATQPFPQQFSGLLRTDPDLFWSVQPGLDGPYADTTVRTNSLGLRSEEIGPKSEDEFRILSLGESSTFGIGVANDETYSAVLEARLREAFPGREIRVVNAGTSAWSSFQSLKFLELRGLALEPDLVLFYHEFNDYLPTAVRGTTNDEVGILLTDKQLYESRVQSLGRTLRRVSALYRFLAYGFARWQLRNFDATGFENPAKEIGLADVQFQPQLVERGEDGGTRPTYLAVDERALGHRVSPDERTQVLEELAALTRREGIDLVVIHPAYAGTQPHDCELTRFCRTNGVTMFEAFESLRPEGEPAQRHFRDPVHPNRAGHRALGEGLAAFLRGRVGAP